MEESKTVEISEFVHSMQIFVPRKMHEKHILQVRKIKINSSTDNPLRLNGFVERVWKESNMATLVKSMGRRTVKTAINNLTAEHEPLAKKIDRLLQ